MATSAHAAANQNAKSLPQDSETEIRSLIEGWGDAIRDKDATRLMQSFADDALLFDLINPLQYEGSDAGRKRATEWLASFQGPIDYRTRDLAIAASGDVAVCHMLNGVRGTTRDGHSIDMWWRATACLRKSDGRWTVTHQHSSVPFDMATGKASMDLQP